MSIDVDAELVVREGGDEVDLGLRTGWRPQDVARGVLLVERAIAHARAAHARTVVTSLGASSPASGAVLAALRRQVGGDLEGVTTRRAGASVLVELRLTA